MSRNETAGSGAGGGDRGQEVKKRITESGKNTQAWRQEKRQDQFREVKTASSDWKNWGRWERVKEF